VCRAGPQRPLCQRIIHATVLASEPLVDLIVKLPVVVEDTFRVPTVPAFPIFVRHIRLFP
jgi:hypothetical protein